MKNQELEMISKLTGSSKSAVSKALNHCFGVDRENREKILSAARENRVGAHRDCFVYIMLPDLPNFFWENVLKKLLCLRGPADCKFNIYSRGSSFVLGEYLSEAERLKAGLLLIAIRPDAEQSELLRKFAKKVPIIFLIDRVDIPNTFYIGSDAYEDGAAIFDRAGLPDGARALLLDDGSLISDERARGFSERGAGRIEIHRIRVPGEPNAASELARIISASGITAPELIYSCAGQLRETALAAVKLNLRGRAAVAGHDFYDSRSFTPQSGGNISGVEFVSVNQNIDEICRRAVGAVTEYVSDRRFPGEKYIRVPPTE